ncbi:TFIIH basal transcription factor complex p47 subunit [Ascosphaera apis ARSEF 7405]|uniref:General transcription and DNA repair factor IIH n=1 Tax=Ascosphaera apis ARSEF 7405 TaxID=392613 RepID=A0A167ZH95_9EURO|nr:TFIIH basal transcription factor complex p47 subunit [Ascosphaera apis ARSEF 7405]
MSDSSGSDSDDLELRTVSSGQPGALNGQQERRKRKRAGGKQFEVARTWETLVEGADGTIKSTVEGLLEAGKRKRLLRDTTPLQRGIIRHVVLVIDLSLAMAEKDLRPTRYLLTLRYASEFVLEFFEQNPISQLGILGMRDGIAVHISDMSGNPTQHLSALRELRAQDPRDMPSLQNALEMARGMLFHTPSHGTREVIIIFGSLCSSDPGDIHETISHLIADKIRVSIVGLAAQVAICREICARTNNDVSGKDDVNDDGGYYTIAIDEVHFKELLMAITTPPVTHSQAQAALNSSLLLMGFPSRTVEQQPSLCACHSKPTRGGYSCSRCGTKVCNLPAECPSCGLTLILSTHLARSYHHLFPLMNYVEVSWKRASKKKQKSCFSCAALFPPIPAQAQSDDLQTSPTKKRRKGSVTLSMGTGVTPGVTSKGISPSSRYECTVCRNHFCIDCDVFAHEVVHNCPGCQSTDVLRQAEEREEEQKKKSKKSTHAAGSPIDGQTVERQTPTAEAR